MIHPSPSSGDPLLINLDKERINPTNVSSGSHRRLLPPGEGILPSRSGGAIPVQERPSASLFRSREIEQLYVLFRRPYLLTLTLHRRNYDLAESHRRIMALPEADRERLYRHPEYFGQMPLEELAYRIGSVYVGRLLRQRLELKRWYRVVEPQPRTGSGMLHWHVLIDLAGTRWMNRSGWVDERGLTAKIRSLWADKWDMGDSVDLRPYESDPAHARAVAVYLSKNWPAVPPWVLLTPYGIRVVDMSQELRDTLKDPDDQSRRVAAPRTPRATSPAPRSRRATRSNLLTRSIQEQLSSKLFVGFRYVTTIDAPLDMIIDLARSGQVPGLELGEQEVKIGGSTSFFTRPFLNVPRDQVGPVVKTIKELLNTPDRRAAITARYLALRKEKLAAWALMQAQRT